MEFDFFAFVGDRVDTRPIDALGQEVAFRIVAAEETEQMVVDLVLKPADIDRVVGQLGTQILDLRKRLGIGAEALRLLDRLGELLLQLRLVGGLVEAECLLHLREQVLVEKLRHLRALGVHDAVEAEIEIGLVELEQLLQQGFQLLKFLAHARLVSRSNCIAGGSNDPPTDGE